jgi:hypothetical protein
MCQNASVLMICLLRRGGAKRANVSRRNKIENHKELLCATPFPPDNSALLTTKTTHKKIRDNSRNSWLKKSSYVKATADATYLSKAKSQQ